MGSKKPTILICDDSLLIRKKMKDCLSEIGDFEVVEAATGLAAVEMYGIHKPELVFLDIVMPEKTGLEALKEIKGMGDPKVVILSSSGTRTHLKQAMEAGADDFIQKPWENTQIQHIIKNLFK